MTEDIEILPPSGDGTLSLAEYATAHGVSTRTVKRWLADDELPGAVKDPFTGAWRIPAHAARALRATPVAMSQPQNHSEASVLHLLERQGGLQLTPSEPAEPTLREDLDDEPGYLDLPTASRYLGIPQAQILANAEKFGIERVGTNGSARVPQRIVRRIMGY